MHRHLKINKRNPDINKSTCEIIPQDLNCHFGVAKSSNLDAMFYTTFVDEAHKGHKVNVVFPNAREKIIDIPVKPTEHNKLDRRLL